MITRRFAAAFIVLLATAPLFADTYNVDRNHSEATFKVRHLISSVSGKFDEFAGSIEVDEKNPAASFVNFTIKTASIDTGVADRDNHLRSADFFDAEKNPEISFKSVSIKPAGKQNVYSVTGDLTMRGVTKRVTLPVEFLGFAKDPWGNQRAGFTLSTTINRKDYGINWNKALDNGGYLLSDDVNITVNLEAVKARPAAKDAAAGK